MSPQHLSRLSTRGVKLSLLLSLILAVCVTALVFTARSGAQEREVVDKIPAHLPVKFKVKNPEKAKDLANDDWLRDIEIEVKNTGTKPIYFLRFSLFFIDVKKDGGGQIGYPLAYGRHQMLDIDERAKPEDVPIMPGETHVFKMPTSYVKGWNWYRTKVEPKPHPKKIGLRFYELNFGDGTGFTGTGGDPIPSRKSSVNQRENPTRAAREWLSPHPSLPVNNVSFLPAAFAPVNFFTEALGSSLPTTTSPQTCCPGTPCQKMKTVLGGNCFCEEGGPPTHVESVFDCNSSAACGTMEMEFIECGVGTADYHTCTNFFRASCGSTFPTPTPTPEESPTPDPSATPEPCPEPELYPACCTCLNLPASGRPGGLPSWECSFCTPNTPLPGGCWSREADLSCRPGYSDYGNGFCCPNPPPPPCPDPPPTYPCDALIPDHIDACPYKLEPCPPISPVLVDVRGDGFALTDAAGGVRFDLDADGAPEQSAWTRAGSDDAWLALDRDGDGRVGGGRELFGNVTPQPAPPPGEGRHGFLALAVFDGAAKGGNGDGVIDGRDAVFARLRLWRDADHDGASGPAELFTLAALDVARLHLNYKESKRVDGHGNEFRYRAKVDDARGAKVNRWAWDVFLTKAP